MKKKLTVKFRYDYDEFFSFTCHTLRGIEYKIFHLKCNKLNNISTLINAFNKRSPFLKFFNYFLVFLNRRLPWNALLYHFIDSKCVYVYMLNLIVSKNNTRRLVVNITQFFLFILNGLQSIYTTRCLCSITDGCGLITFFYNYI